MNEFLICTLFLLVCTVALFVALRKSEASVAELRFQSEVLRETNSRALAMAASARNELADTGRRFNEVAAAYSRVSQPVRPIRFCFDADEIENFGTIKEYGEILDLRRVRMGFVPLKDPTDGLVMVRAREGWIGLPMRGTGYSFFVDQDGFFSQSKESAIPALPIIEVTTPFEPRHIHRKIEVQS